MWLMTLFPYRHPKGSKLSLPPAKPQLADVSQFILRPFLLHCHLTSFLVYLHIPPPPNSFPLFIQEAFCCRQAMCHQSEDRLQLCHPNKPSNLCYVDPPLPEIMSALLLCPFEFSEVLAVCWFFCICSFYILFFSVNAWNWVLSAGTSLCLRGHCPACSIHRWANVLRPIWREGTILLCTGILKY